ALAEQLRKGDRLPGADGDPAISPAQDPRGGEQGFCALLLLLAAEQLVLVAAGLDDPLVGKADGREVRIRLHPREPGVYLEREHAELGRKQLAGPRAPALDEELLRESVLQQALHVGAHRRRVDAVAAEGAADEEGAARAQQPPDGPDVQVVARGAVRRLQAAVVAAQ